MSTVKHGLCKHAELCGVSFERCLACFMQIGRRFVTDAILHWNDCCCFAAGHLAIHISDLRRLDVEFRSLYVANLPEERWVQCVLNPARAYPQKDAQPDRLLQAVRHEGVVFSSAQFRVILLPRPLARHACSCCQPLDALGDHRAACALAGVFAAHAVRIERELARVCCEAGACVTGNVRPADMNFGRAGAGCSAHRGCLQRRPTLPWGAGG